MNLDDISAEVYYTSDTNVHYLKIEIAGMYISNITVQKSVKYPDRGLWVQMPSYQKNGMWKRIVEFAPTSLLKEKIEQACIEAVEAISNDPNDDLMSQSDLRKALDALPFN